LETSAVFVLGRIEKWEQNAGPKMGKLFSVTGKGQRK